MKTKKTNSATLTPVLAILLISSVAIAESVVIEAAQYLDVESGNMMSPAVLVIDNGRIVDVNPESIGDGINRIELEGMTLLPGLIDTHTHLTLDFQGDWQNRPMRETVPERALRGAKNAHTTLMAGFTTVRDLGSRGGAPDVALAHAVEAGHVPGPQIFPSGHSLSITGGHCDISGLAPGILEGSPENGIADGIEEVTKAVRYQIKHGAKVIKICATAGVLSREGPAGAQQYSIEELRAIVEESRRHGIRIAAHAHGTEGIMAATEAGVTSIEHGSILTREAARFMAKNGTYLVPTLYIWEAVPPETLPPISRAKVEEMMPLTHDSFRYALEAGVKIAFGTDAAVYPHGDNAKEFAVMVRKGMQPLEAIRAATLNAADLLGLDDRGSLQVGRRADIIAVAGNPLADISVLQDVRFVMKGGSVYKRRK
jgi:imidazolonepropionase-like amidohydrolase